jgi:acetyl esterase/lipase
MPSEQFDAMVTMLEAAGLGSATSLSDQRTSIDGLGQLLPMAPGTTVTEVDAGGVPAAWITPGHTNGDATAVLWLHGGGYNIGGTASHQPLASHLAAELGAPVLVPAYRLAPEHPYPAALNDADAAWEWLTAHGHEPSRVAVGGDSAGGGLTVALAARLRRSGRPLPGALVVLCPWVDLTGQHPVPDQRVSADVVLSPTMLRTWAAGYAADTPLDEPGISPLFGDLSGLPPILIKAGGRDTLLDDAIRLARQCTEAGVTTELRVDDDMIHAWQLFAGAFPEAGASLAAVATWVRSTLTS